MTKYWLGDIFTALSGHPDPNAKYVVCLLRLYFVFDGMNAKKSL
jgi:hypothetical protein